MDWFNSIEGEWENAVTRWESVVMDFQRAIERHYANRDKAIQLGDFDEWQNKLDNALKVKTAIEMLQDGLATTSTWARETFGLSGIKRIASISHSSGMGALPLIPVAVIVGSISTVSGIIYALVTYNNELDRKWAYIEQNPDMTPDQVAALLESSGGSLFTDFASGVQSTAFWIVAGGLVLFFGPELLKRWKR